MTTASEPRGSVARVRDAVEAAGIRFDLKRFPQGTRTSAEAAAAVGCAVSQIAKSLVFRGAESGRPVLVIASGVNRVDMVKLAALLGEEVQRPDARYVRERTGFAIGGVAPAGHLEPPRVLIDADLMALPEIWAAAGAPDAVFRLSPESLRDLTAGEVAEVRED
ncbi:MAG: YbaK/EbsC family protein [Rhodovibrionaceae bacterium]|nr:YbaK/EbsC family protein [Rhodovibrionaceae bacterium]